MKFRLAFLLLSLLLTGSLAASGSASAATAISPFSVTVSSKNFSKFGASGQLVKSIRIRGAGVRQARPQVSCNPKYCGRWSRARGKTKRSRLYRSPIVFSNVNWVISKGNGFTVKLLPKSKKKLGLYVVMSPPDALNKRFAVSSAGCLRRSGKKTACPPGTVLPTINFKRPEAPKPVYVPGGDLATVSYGIDKLMLLTTSGDGKLWFRTHSPPEVWSDWQHVGGELASGPGAVSIADGRVDVFARDRRNQLVRTTFTENVGWSGWSNIGGAFTGTPSASSWGGNRINIFFRTPTGSLAQIYSDNAGESWSDWADLGGCLSSSPTSASWSANRVDVFIRNCTTNSLRQFYYSSGTWNQSDLGGVLASAPAAVTLTTGHLDVYVTNTVNRVVHKSFSAGWTAFLGIGSPVVTSEVSAGTVTDGGGTKTVRVYSRDESGRVTEAIWHPSTGWAPWKALWD